MVILRFGSLRVNRPGAVISFRRGAPIIPESTAMPRTVIPVPRHHSRSPSSFVIPAHAGIQSTLALFVRWPFGTAGCWPCIARTLGFLAGMKLHECSGVTMGPVPARPLPASRTWPHRHSRPPSSFLPPRHHSRTPPPSRALYCRHPGQACAELDSATRDPFPDPEPDSSFLDIYDIDTPYPSGIFA